MLILDQLNKADRQLRLLAWVIAAGLLLLLAGAWWVQVVRAGHYADSQHNQSYRSVRVPAPRGNIYDRHGQPLAENRPSYNVSLYLEDRALRQAVQAEYRNRRAAVLAAAGPAKKRLKLDEQRALGRAARFHVVSNVVAQLGANLEQSLSLNEKRFHQHYEQRLALPMPVATGLTAAEIARFQERALHLPGVDMEVQPTRIYPHGEVAAHVLGYLMRSEESAEDEISFYNYRLPDFRGVSGLEWSMESKLRGRAGAESVLVNNLGFRQSKTVWSPVEAGQNVTLTIDVEIQRKTERALAQAQGADTRGAAVVLDCRTGDILALASAPAFNPGDFIPRVGTNEWARYSDETLTPLLNKAVYGGYPPGSIFKIVVALAAYDAGMLNPTNLFRVEPDPQNPAKGCYFVGQRKIKDTADAGDYDFKRAFIKSSNSYFADHGLRAGPDRILALSQRFHFGERTGIPLGQDSKALLPTREWQVQNRGGWSPGDTANLSIGQGDLLVTPLQAAVAIAAVANGGKVLWPRLVSHVAGPDELVRPDAGAAAPRVRDELPVSRRALELVRAAMLADVEDPAGTGTRARVDGFRVCGKTGTAEVWKGKDKHYVVWFASFAPFDNPRYAVVVMVDHGASGGATCAPVAAKIYQALKEREKSAATPKRDALAAN
jgi:penicillin-binding protein 2